MKLFRFGTLAGGYLTCCANKLMVERGFQHFTPQPDDGFLDFMPNTKMPMNNNFYC
jgi:hypothetical protein